MASIETLRGGQAKAQTPQKGQLPPAEGGSGSSPAAGTPFAATHRRAASRLRWWVRRGCERGPEAPLQAVWIAQERWGWSPADGLGPCASWGKQPGRMGGSSWRRMLLPGLGPQGVPGAGLPLPAGALLWARHQAAP